jgi:pyruvate/2-oxoglutarate dehydrogenase complex dihydrolipoamide acyltransferase (E2) component
MNDLTQVLVPQMNANDEHAVLVQWHVQSGSWIDAGQTLATMETSKSTFDVDAPCAGYAFFDYEQKSLVPVGGTLVRISATKEEPAAATSTPEISMPAETEDARFTRKALKRMKELGLSQSDFRLKERVDVNTVERIALMRSNGRRAVAEDIELSERAPSKILEAQMLAQVYRQVVPSTVAAELSVEKTDERLRQCATQSGSPSLLELVIYEVGRLLADYPDLNGLYIDGQAWRHRTINIGFAVNIGKGLRVPVVKRAGELSLTETSCVVRDLSLRYMRNELGIEDLTGGSFTVTDLSGFGAQHFIPVLNDRQSAILGICAERATSGCRDLVLTFDHRISDGMRAAMFLSELKARLEGAATPAAV